VRRIWRIGHGEHLMVKNWLPSGELT
jgi:hypothetical protein